MTDIDDARTLLRTATAGHHDTVDALFSQADLSSRAGYGRFLQAQAAAHLPVERALSDACAEAVLPDWPSRRRAPLLQADLAALGLDIPADSDGPTFDSPAAILGGIYVLEGSRLGGTLLRRSLPPGFPDAFLGAADSAAWRRLLAHLGQALHTPEKRRSAVDAASATFLMFEAAGRRHFQGTV